MSIKFKPTQEVPKNIKVAITKANNEIKKLENKVKVQDDKIKAIKDKYKEKVQTFKKVTKEDIQKIQQKKEEKSLKKMTVRANFTIEYQQKHTTSEGNTFWVPAKGEVWGDQKELKYKTATKETVQNKYIESEYKRIEALFDDSHKKIVGVKVNRLYANEIKDDKFSDLIWKKMKGTSVHMSMPSIGVKYTDYDDSCVPMALLHHLNNPENKKENRIQSMTLETIVNLLNKPVTAVNDEVIVTENIPTVDNWEQKLKDGYCPLQIMNVCNDPRVRVRMYCLDHREKVILSNAQDIPDEKRNKKIPSLVYMSWNNHCYVIENTDVKNSVTHTYASQGIGCKQKGKISNVKLIIENEKKRKSVCLENIPQSFNLYKNMIVYITGWEEKNDGFIKKVNPVNDFFYDEIKRGIIHKEGLRLKDREVLKFEYTPTKTLLMYKPDYDEVVRIAELLNEPLIKMNEEIKKSDNTVFEKLYEVENNTVHSLALEYYTRNYGHSLSFMNVDGNDVMNSPLNSAFNEYWRLPTNINECHQYDYCKHYTSCLINNELGFSVYSPLDQIQPFNMKLVEGFYYVETNNYFPMKGNCWYNGEPLIEYINDGIISLDDIKYQYLPSNKLENNHFVKFVEDIFNKFSINNNEKSAKLGLNGFIGLLRKTTTKSNKSFFTNNFEEVCYHYNDMIDEGNNSRKLPINYIENDEGDVIGYHIINESEYPLQKTNIPIYRKIYDMSALYLWRLVKRVGNMSNVLGIHTDTIYFQGGKRLEEDGIKFGGIRKEVMFPLESVNIVERKVDRVYKREYDFKVFDDFENDDEIYNSDIGCMVTGMAGTGKSYIIGKLGEYFTEKNVDYKVSASTWKAGIKINGSTVHSLFGIDPTKPTMNISVCKAILNSGINNIIIDEISMIPLNVWGILHQIKALFGFTFYLFGDYNQLPPVSEEEAYLRYENSRLVRFICDNRRRHLTVIHRQKEEKFINELKSILNGGVITKNMYGKEECEFAIAYTNKMVNEHNMKYMKKKAIESEDYEIMTDKNKTLYLFQGLKVIANVTNGTYVNCENFEVEWFDSKDVGLKNIRQKIEMKRSELIKNFNPYYAITVHKAQGDTFDFPFTIYEYRYLAKMGKSFIYTALSRSTKLSHINLIDECQCELKGYIYQYEHNNKKYIGSTFNLDEMKKQHKESKETDKFHIALRKEKFKFSILREIFVGSDEELREKEAWYILKENSVENGYNSKVI